MRLETKSKTDKGWRPFLWIEREKSEFDLSFKRALKGIQDGILETAKKANYKELHELTEQEKFSIAVLAGVPLKPQDIREKDFKLETVPCSITKDKGVWLVFIKDYHESH